MEKTTKEMGFLTASDDIDVSEIMDRIKKTIEEKKDSGVLKQKEIDEIEEMELLPLPDFLDIPNAYQPHLYPENLKRDSFEEYTPVEFHAEVEAGFVKKIMGKIRKLGSPLIRFFTRPLYNELKRLTIDLHNSNKRSNHDLMNDMKMLEYTTGHSKEYIKLLHNTINNMIVESSKMKIEEEMLKTRIKVLEDKLVFLENRERALEKKVYQ